MNMHINEAETDIKIDELLNTGGSEAETLIAKYAQSPLVGKKLIDTPCPNCGIAGHLWITQQEQFDDTNSIVTVQCKNCGKSSRLEIEIEPEIDFNPNDLAADSEEPEENKEEFGGSF